MALELIADLLAEVEDDYASEVVERSETLQAQLTEEQNRALEALEKLHRERAFALASRAMLAGVAMGRGLGA